MNFFMTMVTERVALDNTLRKVNALMDWQHLEAILGQCASGSCRRDHCKAHGASTPSVRDCRRGEVPAVSAPCVFRRIQTPAG